MSGISDAEVVSALRRQMTIATARQVAAAGNLANIDTPNFKAVEVSFADALDSKMAPVATQPGHVGEAAANPIRTQEIRDTPARRDGNTVVLDRELLTMNRASGDFSAAQTALAENYVGLPF